MDFTFARATWGRAVFAVFASSDEPVRRDQRDAARFRAEEFKIYLANHYNFVMIAR
jgi:hypothetical protein